MLVLILMGPVQISLWQGNENKTTVLDIFFKGTFLENPSKSFLSIVHSSVNSIQNRLIYEIQLKIFVFTLSVVNNLESFEGLGDFVSDSSHVMC